MAFQSCRTAIIEDNSEYFHDKLWNLTVCEASRRSSKVYSRSVRGMYVQWALNTTVYHGKAVWYVSL